MDEFRNISVFKIPHSEVRDVNGVPTIFLEGKPLTGMAFFGRGEWPEIIREISSTGIHLYTPPIRLGWMESGHFEYEETDRQISSLLQADPEAMILPRVSLNAPRPWQEEHPEELCLFHDAPREEAEIKDLFKRYTYDETGYAEGEFSKQSFASELWQREAREALYKFIAHITESAYSSHIIGYHIAFGISGEAHMWGGWSGKFADYSRPMQGSFRRWLLKKYKDITRLNHSWGTDFRSFNEICIPSRDERVHTELFTLRDVKNEKKVIDYHEFISDLTSDVLIFFARAVKEITKNRALCGAFYGYLLECIWDSQSHLQNIGHLKLSKVLKSPYIDFLAGPTTYWKRGVGGSGGCMSLLGSVRLHGKVWFNEADIRTHKSPADAGFGRCGNIDETKAVLRRELAYVLTHGAALWWMDQSRGWFSDSNILNTLHELEHITEVSARFKREYRTGFAVIVDDRSCFYLNLTNELLNPLVYTMRDRFARVGTAYHLYHIDDLDNPQMPDYGMYIFLNTFFLDERQRQVIAKKVMRNKNVVVWMYAPGVLTPALSMEAMGNLIGFKMGMELTTAPLNVKVAPGSHPIIRDLSHSVTFGTSNAVGPHFFVDDPSATVLGRLPDGKAGLAVGDMGTWISVYIAAPDVPPVILRGIARMAGVHIFSDADQTLYADEHFLAIHTSRYIDTILYLPQRTDIYDIFTKRVIGKDCEQIRVKLQEKTTTIYFLGKFPRLLSEHTTRVFS